MESLKKKYNNLPLRKFFVISVLFTICFVAALSGMVIFGCTAFRHYLLPDPNAVYLTIERTLSDGSTVTSVQLFEFDDDPQKFAQLVSDQKEQNTVLDEKYSIQKIEKSYDTMGPRRKLAYQSCGVIMAAYAILLLASSASVLNPSASLTANSASIFLLISTPATFKPCIILLYDSPFILAAALIRAIQS